MNILIRLPNWLGDMVMSTAFVQAVKTQYPEATIDLITKKGIDVLLDYFPQHANRYIFSKNENKGLGGLWRFGKEISKQKQYDLFFCLPDSFSSALMGYATNAKNRIGYKKEGRSILLSSSYHKKNNLHRVEGYIDLLEQYRGEKIETPAVKLSTSVVEKRNGIVININSEASSRRLPKEKAVSMINAIRNRTGEEITLIGGTQEKNFVEDVFAALQNKKGLRNLAGKTNLPQLVELLSTSKLLLSTDSGPAHLANALWVQTIVLFGAGNENNTAPFNKMNCTTIRLGKLSCEPCTNNTCKKYGIPQCLIQLDETIITQQVLHSLSK